MKLERELEQCRDRRELWKLHARHQINWTTSSYHSSMNRVELVRYCRESHSSARSQYRQNSSLQYSALRTMTIITARPDCATHGYEWMDAGMSSYPLTLPNDEVNGTKLSHPLSKTIRVSCMSPSTCRVGFRKDILIIDTSSHQYTPQHIFHSWAVSQQTVLINHIRGNILIYCNCSSGTSLTPFDEWMDGCCAKADSRIIGDDFFCEWIKYNIVWK